MRYAIYEGNMERLTKKMTRIQNKCRKYGCDFRFEEVGEEYKELEDSDGNKYTARFVDVEAEGIAKVNGWRFIATLQHTSEGNIINKAVDDVEVPERYYTCEPFCEHCQSRRHRNETYIVMNEETGEFKQVGKNCLCDFTHGMSTEAVADYTSMFNDLIQGAEPYDAGHIESYVETDKFLRYVAECIHCFGYVKNEPTVRSTRDRAEQYYFTDNGGRIYSWESRQKFDAEMQEAGFDAESTEARQMTCEALQWITDQPESNNYMHNLRTACSLKYQKMNNLGLIASLFPTFNRELEYQAQERKKAEEAAQSEYVGEIGQRISIKVHDISCVTSWETQWGITKIYKIMDEAGNAYMWKTSTYVPENIDTIKGTVKAHTEYRGQKQTEITRCSVTRKAKEPESHPEPSYDADKAIEQFLAFCEE